MNTCTPACSPTRLGRLRLPAFSLIEVLIGVMVLALGLLGLGMVFPVVVRQQRQAQDSIQGITSVRSAASYILGRTDLFTDPTNPGGAGGNKVWAYAVNEANKEGSTVQTNRWQTPALDPTQDFSIRSSDGRIAFTLNGATAYIPAVDRLVPKPFSSASGPQFVWDFAVRKSGLNSYQVAVFSRRVDPGIRLPVNNMSAFTFNLSNVLTGEPTKTFPKAAFRVPVATDSKGRPTLNGADENNIANYSVPRLISPAVRGGSPSILPGNLLRLSGADAALLSSARQPGQKLIDNRGTVHTVLRAAAPEEVVPLGLVAADAGYFVFLERRMSDDLIRDIEFPDNKFPVNFVLTPQVPAAVTVLDLQR